MNLGEMVSNAMRRLTTMYPGYFSEAKHNHYKDFGWPENVAFDMAYGMYRRNGIARAAVNQTVLKTWQDYPFLLEKPRDGGTKFKRSDETPLESEIRQHFDDINFWQCCAEADRRNIVGRYSGLILRVADNKTFDQPVQRVPGGLDGLVEVIPAWEGQLRAVTFDDDQNSPTYGEPLEFQYNEAAVGSDVTDNRRRQLVIHRDRVVIWSNDGGVGGTSDLEPGYNDLITMEKVSGSGGEGFWKNAKSAPVLQVDKDARLETMAQMFGVPVAELADKMGEQVEDWQKGFDKLLMLQGIEAKTIAVTLPQPMEFFTIALQSFAASQNIPSKILIGTQAGKLASTEDTDNWAQTNNSRRQNIAIPTLKRMIKRLETFGILPERDWTIEWSDLTESSITEKIDRAAKMADVNAKMQPTGELVFMPEEIRRVVDLEPLTPDQMNIEPTEADQAAALAPQQPVKEPAK